MPLDRPVSAPSVSASRHNRHNRHNRILPVTGVLLVLALLVWLVLERLPGHRLRQLGSVGAEIVATSASRPDADQTAYTRDLGPRPRVVISGAADPVPIASVAKVMTAYVVLLQHPIDTDDDGPSLRVTATDVEDTRRRAARDESLVPVAEGEELTERQALLALLLPSANNVAQLLARWSAGSVADFVDDMNFTADRLGMRSTDYTDPSGYEPSTVSTAADQLVLLLAALGNPTLAALLGTRSAELPVTGTVRNTNTLLGHDGFVAGKTGSDDAAGGCLVFRAIRTVDGQQIVITGVVLGVRGLRLIPDALRAAQQLADAAEHG
jgi:D-alanyl-D-alanine carboxypeptidase (penicillin-binding protein 5/6)